MTDQITNTLILAAVFLSLFAIAEFLYHKLNVKAELTRKLVHAGTGLITLMFPVMIRNKWLVLALCASFAVLLFVSLCFSLLRSINGIDRKSHGSLSYPAAVFVCYCVYEYESASAGRAVYEAFYLPVLILAICDPLAALCGRKWPRRPFRTGTGVKTLSGSFSFFISALLVSMCVLLACGYAGSCHTFFLAFILAAVTAFAEAVTSKGFDNLSIPFSASAVFFIFSHFFLRA